MARCIKSSKELKALDAYSLEYEERLDDCNSQGLVFRHKKSKARICVVSNEDDNKVFMIGFRTPPKDSTGVAHIIEHTVLCGSKNFPVKDPFIELAKGSLNTFLNAITYSDKTVYPVASCNDKDFQNLMHVYMDAVFYPNIYSHREIFEQEGWHYEMDSEDAELTYNGIVYSEMKGAFSSPEQKLAREARSSLFPDTSYGVESGGDPDSIPDLTYEEYLEFHKKYYSPANSYIYLYGDMDVEEKLEWLDQEYLSSFDEVVVDSALKYQPAFEAPKKITSYYSLSDSEDEKDNTYLTFNVAMGDSINVKECIAMQIIESALLSSPGAPLKQALIDAGIGKDILSSYDNELLQPTFDITAKNANEADLDKFISIIQENLKKAVKEGLNEKSLLAAINVAEFRYREADFGQFPKGLLFGLTMLGSWLYDDSKAFIYMHGNEIFAQLKEEIKTGYFEGLIQKFLIDNTHITYLMLKPQKGLTAQNETKLKEKLAAYKESLSSEEKQAIVAATKHLKEYQETPTPQEDLEKIPLLSVDDIEKSAQELNNDLTFVNKLPVLHHNVFTNGIAYVKCIFDLSRVPVEYVPYLNLFTTCLGYMDTANYSYSELANEMNIHTGGMSSEMAVYNKRLDPDKYNAVMYLSTKALYSQLSKAVELMKEIITSTKFEDTKRLLEIIQECKSRLQMKLNSAGHSAAVDRAFSYFNESGYYTDATKGIGYYKFLADLEEHFNERKEELTLTLKKLCDMIFTSDGCFISVTAEAEGFAAMKACIPDFMSVLSGDIKEEERSLDQVLRPAAFHFPLKKVTEGFTYSGQVQYVARCGNFVKDGFTATGALKVLRTIMSYDYLWNKVRVKGGAYGCMCQFGGLDGSAYMVSYRDPNLKETDTVYKEASDYVKNFEVSERDMTKYIIGTMSMVDTPLTPMMRGARSLGAYVSGVSYEDIQRDRNQILTADKEAIRALAPIIAAIVAEDNLCVIGNEQKVKENKDMFDEIKPLF